MGKLTSLVLMACLATLSLCGCVAQEPDDDSDADDSYADDPAAAELGKGGGGYPTCDDFDTYCGPSRPCGAGYICAYAPNVCGQNVFGTYPNCATTATCYPVCIPGEKQ